MLVTQVFELASITSTVCVAVPATKARWPRILMVMAAELTPNAAVLVVNVGFVSSTQTSKVYAPAAVGVPVRLPVAPPRLKPVGKPVSGTGPLGGMQAPA